MCLDFVIRVRISRSERVLDWIGGFGAGENQMFSI